MREAKRAAAIELCKERLRSVEARGARSSCWSSIRNSSTGSMGPADQAMRLPDPIKPARSMSSVILGVSLLAECGDPLGEVRACPHTIAELLLEGLPSSGEAGDASANLRF